MRPSLILKRNSAGFTLSELLVTTTIIVISAMVFFVSYRDVGKQLTLQRAANKLAQDIRRAGYMAMAAAQCPVGTGCAGSIPAGGYGIYLESGNPNYCPNNQPTCYILYADTNGSGQYESDAEIETIQLEKGVTISDIDRPPEKVSINFRPPSPKIQITPSGLGGSGVKDVNITLSNGTATTTVTVNTVGLIYIQ